MEKGGERSDAQSQLWRNLQWGAGEGGDDLLAVEAAVFNEDFAGVVAADYDAGEVQAGDVTFEGLRIEAGLIGGGIKFHAETAQEREVGVVTGHGKGLH